MSDKSKLIEKIEDIICDIVDQMDECKVSKINCRECLRKYAQIIVDKNLDNNKNRYDE